MQASGQRLGMRSIARILYQDEGLFRFWKGAQVMASGCVPAHASYFLAYEHLKMYLNFDNEHLNFSKTLLIGSTTTFAHDFFITPADGKSWYRKAFISLYGILCLQCLVCSDQVKTLAVQKFDGHPMHQECAQRRRSSRPLQILSPHRVNEYTIRKLRGLCQWEPEDYNSAMGALEFLRMVLPLCGRRRRPCRTYDQSSRCG